MIKKTLSNNVATLLCLIQRFKSRQKVENSKIMSLSALSTALTLKIFITVHVFTQIRLMWFHIIGEFHFNKTNVWNFLENHSS